MELENVQAIIQTASVALALLVSAGTLRRRDAERTADLAVMRRDIRYIKDRIDGLDQLRERLTRVEREAASAHRRMDEHLTREHGVRAGG